MRIPRSRSKRAHLGHLDRLRRCASETCKSSQGDTLFCKFWIRFIPKTQLTAFSNTLPEDYTVYWDYEASTSFAVRPTITAPAALSGAIAPRQFYSGIGTYLCTYGAGCALFTPPMTVLPAGSTKYFWCLKKAEADGTIKDNCGEQFSVSMAGGVSVQMGK